jgi:hypothetical protein
MDPNKGGSGYLHKKQGNSNHYLDFHVEQVTEEEAGVRKREAEMSQRLKVLELKQKRLKLDDASSMDFLGPWAGYDFETDFSKKVQLSEE